MKITKIEPQVKTKGRYSVFVDDKFAFGVSDLGLLEFGIKVGQEINDSELEDLKKNADTDKVYNLALNLIARRPRSEWEMNEYLARKKVGNAASQEIVSKLTEKGYLNDYKFAKSWVNNRRLLKSVSRRKLELELRAKRIDTSLISKVLSEDELDDSSVIVKEIEKKRRQSRYKDDVKLKQYLLRQGYSYEDINNAMN